MPTITPKSEDGTGSVYVVYYDENLWKSYDTENQQFCFDTWLRKAGPCGCEMVSLWLVPDQFFPLHGHDVPYCIDTKRCPPNEGKTFKVTTRAYVEIHEKEWHSLDGNAKQAIRDKALKKGEATGCDHWYVLLGNVTLDAGKRS